MVFQSAQVYPPNDNKLKKSQGKELFCTKPFPFARVPCSTRSLTGFPLNGVCIRVILFQKLLPSGDDDQRCRNQVRLDQDLPPFVNQGGVAAVPVVALEGYAEKHHLKIFIEAIYQSACLWER